MTATLSAEQRARITKDTIRDSADAFDKGVVRTILGAGFAGFAALLAFSGGAVMLGGAVLGAGALPLFSKAVGSFAASRALGKLSPTAGEDGLVGRVAAKLGRAAKVKRFSDAGMFAGISVFAMSFLAAPVTAPVLITAGLLGVWAGILGGSASEAFIKTLEPLKANVERAIEGAKTGAAVKAARERDGGKVINLFPASPGFNNSATPGPAAPKAEAMPKPVLVRKLFGV